MKTAARILGRFLAFILVILFVLATALATLLFSAERRVFNAETYKSMLAGQKLYDRLPGLVTEQLVQSTQGSPEFAILNALKPKDIETVLRLIVPPDDLRKLADDALDQVFGYLNGQIADPRLSLQPIKDRLRQDGVRAILQILRAQPACTDAQMFAMAAGTLTGGVPSLDCNPPETLMTTVAVPLLQGLIDQQLEKMPDSVPMRRVGQAAPADSVRLVRLLMRLSPVVPIGLLFLITLLVVHGLGDWLRWWGVPLTIAGVLTALAGLALAPLAVLFFNRTVLPEIAGSVSAGVIQAIIGLITSIAGGLAQPLLLGGGAIGLIGLCLAFAARFVKDPVDPSS